MHATLLSAIFCILQSSTALTASNEKCCSNLASKIIFGTYHAKHLNSTYNAAATVQVPNGASNISNDVPLCEVYASVNYAKGANLFFALWLPENSHYRALRRCTGLSSGSGKLACHGALDRMGRA
jgi:hypothetical protein